MTDRARSGLVGVVLATLAVGIAARAWPLYWSPYPATLDGFRYAWLARTTLELGALPAGPMAADEVVFTAVLAVVSTVTGLPPVRAAQPLVAVTGGVSCLTAVALVARIGRERDWSRRRLRVAAAASGLGIALEGLYVRRSGVPDEEAFGLLLVPLLALAAWHALRSRRYAWWVPTIALALTLPPLHNMSGLVAGLTLTGLVAAALVRARDVRDGAVALALGAGFWVVYFGYAVVAPRVGLTLSYSGLLSGSLGLFVAWVVLTSVVVAWSRSASDSALRAVWLLPVGGWFVLVAVNAVVTVFPGTVPSPTLVLLLIGAYIVPVALVGVGITLGRRGTGIPVVAALLAPVALTYYALTATLTPDFFNLAIRVQSFAHLPAFVFIGAGMGMLVVRVTRAPSASESSSGGAVATDAGSTSGATAGSTWNLATLGRAAVALLFVTSIIATVPLGYIDLDTGAAPSTTTPGEFRAVGFAERHVNGSYATDHALSRVAMHHYREPRAGEEVGPTRGWLQGGPPPDCPVLLGADWTTAGAHLFPAAPETLSQAQYDRFLAERNVVYSSSGADPHALVVPRGNTTGC